MLRSACSAALHALLLALVLLHISVAYILFTPTAGGRAVDPEQYFPATPPPHEPLLRSPYQYERIGMVECIVSGDRTGRLVVLLHGFPETALLSWHGQIDHLVERGFFVVAPDQRGYNTSSKPENVLDYSVEHLALDVIHIIDHFNRPKAVVVGHDWGGVVAWYMGATHPERVERLAILNVPHPTVMSHTLRSSLTQLRNSWYIFFFQVPLVPELKMRMNNFYWITGALAMAKPGTFPLHVVRMYHESWSQAGCIEGMLGWYRAAVLNMFVNPVELGRIPVPAMLIWGDQDTALDASMAAPSVEMCDDGQLVMVPGISHWVQHEAPDKVNAALDSFLAP
eukprot:TRINITY_DN4275_c1_g2_i1.p1 TRINITY_DN4275_c1_g2~~TRINITY_DN4275_c1_g2_i1.p1  ORF type:complete len:373 (+),score=102.79 TRINITY_DN4275_c1_g2_i1:103-1119(+)